MSQPKIAFLLATLMFSIVACAQPTQPATKPSLTPEKIALRDSKMRAHMIRLEQLEDLWILTRDKFGGDHPLAQKVKAELTDLKDRIQIYADDYNIKSTDTRSADERRYTHLAFQNRIFARTQLLNNLKQKYQFRLRDLTQDLRDKTIKLSIDGIGIPGRLSTKEVAISDLLKRQLKISTALSESRVALARLQNNKDQNAMILQEADKDPRLANYIQQIDEIDLKLADGTLSDTQANPMTKRKAALEQKAEKRRADLVASIRAARIESLQTATSTTEKGLAEVSERLSQAKQDLGDLTYQLSQYITAKDEEKTVRELLQQVSRQLDRLALIDQQKDPDDPAWDEIERSIFGPSSDRANRSDR